MSGPLPLNPKFNTDCCEIFQINEHREDNLHMLHEQKNHLGVTYLFLLHSIRVDCESILITQIF